MTFEKKSVTIRGVTYDSMREAADAHGVSVAAVSKAMARGTVDTVGTGSNRSRTVTVKGRTFPSYKALAEHLGINHYYVGQYFAVKAAIEAME